MKTLAVSLIALCLASPALARDGSKATARATAVAQSASQSSSSSSVSNRNTVNVNDRLQPGALGLAGLAASGCIGSFSIGAGFPGGSFGIGSTFQHQDCQELELAGAYGAVGAKARAVFVLDNSAIMERVQKRAQAKVQRTAATSGTRRSSGCKTLPGNPTLCID